MWFAVWAVAANATALPMDFVDTELPSHSTEDSYRYPGPRRPPPRYRPPPRPRAPEEPEQKVSVTVAASGLRHPLIDAAVEARLGKKFSLGVIGGLGGWDGDLHYEVGLQGRGYVLGDFDVGLALGLEGRYADIGLLGMEGPALGVGPIVAAKFTFPIPIVLEAQAGVSYLQGDGWGGLGGIVRVGAGYSF